MKRGSRNKLPRNVILGSFCFLSHLKMETDPLSERLKVFQPDKIDNVQNYQWHASKTLFEEPRTYAHGAPYKFHLY